MRNCYICPAFEYEQSWAAFSVCGKCVLDIAIKLPDLLTANGCTLKRKDIEKMLKQALKGGATFE